MSVLTVLNNRLLARRLLFLLPLMLLLSCESKTQQQQHTISGNTMGTYYQIKLVGVAGQLDGKVEGLIAEIRSLLVSINGSMSTYDPKSSLSVFNRHQSIDALKVPDSLYSTLETAISVSEMTAGAYDVTVGPLVNLWGFGPEVKSPQVPSEKQIVTAKKRVGYQRLKLAKPNQILKTVPDLYVDLSSIAKGYAVDQVSNLLASKGFKNYLVDIGGELRVSGYNAIDKLWRVAVEKPSSEESGVQRILAITDVAVATSGDYRNFFEQDGVRFSHTINPMTGHPVSHSLVSATVVADTCEFADAVATALLVLGTEEALILAERENLAVYLVTKTEDGFVDSYSTALQSYLLSNE